MEARQRTYSVFLHLGKRICRKMFCFLHTICKQRLETVKAHLLQNGFTSRVHGNARRLPVHTLSLADLQQMVQFISNYSEAHAILLSGRVPGYKRDDLELLPASTTKRQIWMQFNESLHSLATPGRTVTYTTFYRTWKHFLPNVLITKPRSDLCWVCQRNTTTIIRAINRLEEKSQVRTTAVKKGQRQTPNTLRNIYMYIVRVRDLQAGLQLHVHLLH